MITCGPTGEGTKARAKEGSIVSARILSTSIFIRLELSMEDDVYKECLKSSKV